jgi:hypothetical protein
VCVSVCVWGFVCCCQSLSGLTWTCSTHIFSAMNQNISKKRKFVADGVFYSELNEVSYLTGIDWLHSGVAVRSWVKPA